MNLFIILFFCFHNNDNKQSQSWTENLAKPGSGQARVERSGSKGANQTAALKKVMSPYKRGFNLDEIYKMASEPGTIAVITAAQSYDGFEAMQDRAKRMGHASMKDILNPKKRTYL